MIAACRRAAVLPSHVLLMLLLLHELHLSLRRHLLLLLLLLLEKTRTVSVIRAKAPAPTRATHRMDGATTDDRTSLRVNLKTSLLLLLLKALLRGSLDARPLRRRLLVVMLLVLLLLLAALLLEHALQVVSGLKEVGPHLLLTNDVLAQAEAGFEKKRRRSATAGASEAT